MRLRAGLLLGALTASIALAYLALTWKDGRIDANPTLAVRGVAPDATNDNGQTKLARATDGTIYLAYSAPEDGVEQAHISFSLDEGQTWKPEITLGQDGIWSDLPAIATGRGGRLDVVWVDYASVGHVWYATRQSGTWSEQTKISPGPDYAGYPAIAISDDDTAQVVWYGAIPDQETEHGSLYQIEHTSNADHSWTSPVVLSTSSDDALNPALAATSGGDLLAAWFQVRDNVYAAEVATLSNGEWTSPELVSVPGVRATGVAVTADAEGVTHLVWEQSLGESTGVAYTRRVNGDWAPVERLSTEGSSDPVVAVDAQGRTFVVWSQRGQIVARMRDGAWSDPVTLGAGTNPTLLSGETVLAAWSRRSEAGDELVTTPMTVTGSTSGLRIGVGILAAVFLVGGLALALWWRQRPVDAPAIDSTDLTSGK